MRHSNTPIFIPTWNRSSIVTLDSLPDVLRKRVVIVAKSQKIGKALANGLDVLTCPIQGKGIYLVRQWLLKKSFKMGLDCLIMLDDDLKIEVGHFNKEGKKQFTSCPNELHQWFDVIEAKCLEDGVAQSGFSYHFFNTTRKRWLPNRNTSSSYFVNLKAIRKHGVDFNMAHMDDRYFQLSAIEKGLSIQSCSMVASKQALTQGTGGETSLGGRSAGVRKVILLLAKRYPRYVVIRGEDERYAEPRGTCIGGGLKVTMYMHRMYKAAMRGEDVRKPK